MRHNVYEGGLRMKTAARTMLLLGGMALLLAVACATAQAGTFVLKFNHVLGAKEPYHQGFTNWAKAVEEKTKGGLKIEVFHSAQLGVEEDILEQIRAGANIGQNTDSARMGNYVPGIAIMNGPYFAENLDEVAKLKNSPTVRGFLDELANKHGMKVL
ncbi:MAG: C4-dicarboxylate transporter, partial [candidate division NC10 bacterium]|nr:C4-dicarboxylate transporter [candidate division NC10 bacterium]